MAEDKEPPKLKGSIGGIKAETDYGTSEKITNAAPKKEEKQK
jgi:hypothetical protein